MPAFAWDALVPAGAPDASLVDLLAATKLFPSKKEIRRLIEQGAVKIGDRKASGVGERLEKTAAAGTVVQAGKRIFVKIL